MRVTNNMILRNSSYNINGTKGSVNSSMNQMTTQKKIDKPSDDPVVAIRSLRLSTGLSRVDQYYKKNIPDAESWLTATATWVHPSPGAKDALEKTLLSTLLPWVDWSVPTVL